jgi:ketosteroid isomerase-like protein
MASANVELVSRVYEMLSARGTLEDWDWFFNEYALVDCEMRPAQGRLPDVGPQSIRGRDGFERFWRAIGEVLEDWQFALEDAFSAPGDRIVAVVRATGRGRGSGVPLNFREAHVWTMQGGKAARIDAYLEVDDALRAVGLQQQA